MHRIPLRALLVMAAAAALGCEAGDRPETADVPGSPADAPGSAAEGEAEPAEAEFAPVNRSGVTGTAAADHEDDQVTVRLELSGLEPGTMYPAHIHSGRCAAGGPVLIPLGRVRARADGSGRLTTRVARSELGGEPAFVQVHGPDGAAISCADLDDDGPMPLTERAPTGTAPDTGGGG